MKRHSLLESQLNFPHSETHLKVPFFNYSLQSANYCPQTYKAHISRMTTDCAPQKSAYRFFCIIYIGVYMPSSSPRSWSHRSLGIMSIWSECTAWEKYQGCQHPGVSKIHMKLHKVDNKTTNVPSG